MCVRQVEEVGPNTIGRGDGTTNRSDAISVGVEDSDLLVAYDGVEVIELLVDWCFVIILLRNEGSVCEVTDFLSSSGMLNLGESVYDLFWNLEKRWACLQTNTGRQARG